MKAVIDTNSTVVRPTKFTKPVCADPDGDKFLEAAVTGNVRYVVSGDKALLAVKILPGIQVLSPGNFLNILEKK